MNSTTTSSAPSSSTSPVEAVVKDSGQVTLTTTTTSSSMTEEQYESDMHFYTMQISNNSSQILSDLDSVFTRLDNIQTCVVIMFCVVFIALVLKGFKIYKEARK